jgi:hypothetical protein
VSTTTRYRLVRPDREVVVPELDEHQQRVVDHEGGPLLVLAGPGTGKTTTLVEAIVDRIEHRGASPDSVLALTFSRKAAEQLRDRVTARLGRTTATQLSATFHSFAYGLVRRFAPAELYEGPLRLLSAPEQDVVLRELLVDHALLVLVELRRRCRGAGRSEPEAGGRGSGGHVTHSQPPGSDGKADRPGAHLKWRRQGRARSRRSRSPARPGS